MLHSSKRIVERVKRDSENTDDPLVITPLLIDEDNLQDAASIDLRLGTWFVTLKARRHYVLDIYSNQEDELPSENSLTNKYYVPFGKEFVLHPRQFVLAITLEWIRVPLSLAGNIAGKSSWGRRGLIVENAPGIQPGFSGCLTLELTNVGEVPIVIKPGTTICQLFLYELNRMDKIAPDSNFFGQRQPLLGTIKLDKYAEYLVTG